MNPLKLPSIAAGPPAETEVGASLPRRRPASHSRLLRRLAPAPVVRILHCLALAGAARNLRCLAPARAARTLLAATLLASAPLASAAELTVSAAASLSQAFRELAGEFERSHPNTTVLLNFGASGALLQQIARGAPVDVFASADHETMDRAAAQGLVSEADRHDFAANRLVVVVPAESGLQLASLSELAAAPVRRLALGIPSTVPAGRYARQALEDAGLWAALEPRVIGAQNVRQALDYVARGEVDAGLVYATDASLMPDKVRQVLEVPTRIPIRYPIASTVAAREPALARAFVAFVRSPQAAAILERHGFLRP